MILWVDWAVLHVAKARLGCVSSHEVTSLLSSRLLPLAFLPSRIGWPSSKHSNSVPRGEGPERPSPQRSRVYKGAACIMSHWPKQTKRPRPGSLWEGTSQGCEYVIHWGLPTEQSATIHNINPSFVDEGTEAQRGDSHCPESFLIARDRGPRSVDSKEHALC